MRRPKSRPAVAPEPRREWRGNVGGPVPNAGMAFGVPGPIRSAETSTRAGSRGAGRDQREARPQR